MVKGEGESPSRLGSSPTVYCNLSNVMRGSAMVCYVIEGSLKGGTCRIAIIASSPGLVENIKNTGRATWVQGYAPVQNFAGPVRLYWGW